MDVLCLYKKKGGTGPIKPRLTLVQFPTLFSTLNMTLNAKRPNGFTRPTSLFAWWPVRDSNPRHEDFQSSALPTELPSHLRCALFQGLISITKDAFRSTENFKKVFEHSLGSLNRHVRGISRQQEVFRSEPHGQTHLASSPRQPPVDEWPPSFPEES